MTDEAKLAEALSLFHQRILALEAESRLQDKDLLALATIIERVARVINTESIQADVNAKLIAQMKDIRARINRAGLKVVPKDR